MAQKEKKPNIIQRTKNWWRQTIGELRKVSWPTKEDALALTRIVLIVTVIMSAILGILDFVFSRLVGILVG
ncbi:MAG: preprotein translocase subunit SecE [Anaerolineaceae bacterium]|jgi:preprotein translocase subunit SecE